MVCGIECAEVRWDGGHQTQHPLTKGHRGWVLSKGCRAITTAWMTRLHRKRLFNPFMMWKVAYWGLERSLCEFRFSVPNSISNGVVQPHAHDRAQFKWSPPFFSTTTHRSNDLSTFEQIATQAMEVLRLLKNKFSRKGKPVPEHSVPVPALTFSPDSLFFDTAPTHATSSYRKPSIVDILPAELTERIILLV